MTSLTPFGIIAAGTIPTLLGMVWYHPYVFGAQWMQLNGISPEMSERATRYKWKSIALSLCAGLCMAYVLNVCAVFARVSSIGQSMFLGLLVWIGLVAPILASSLLWEGRNARLFYINAGYWCITLVAMAVLLYVLRFP